MIRLLTAPTIARVFRASFLARRAQASAGRALGALWGRPDVRAAEARAAREDLAAGRAAATARAGARPRNILFITVDQQRYDALGVNGGRVARTPALDALARAGVNYRRA